MADKQHKLLLTPEEKAKLFEDYPCLDPSFEDDYKTEVELLLEAQIAKVEKPLVDAIVKVAIPSLKYCEDKYGHDNMARVNLEALVEALINR